MVTIQRAPFTQGWFNQASARNKDTTAPRRFQERWEYGWGVKRPTHHGSTRRSRSRRNPLAGLSRRIADCNISCKSLRTGSCFAAMPGHISSGSSRLSPCGVKMSQPRLPRPSTSRNDRGSTRPRSECAFRPHPATEHRGRYRRRKVPRRRGHRLRAPVPPAATARRYHRGPALMDQVGVAHRPLPRKQVQIAGGSIAAGGQAIQPDARDCGNQIAPGQPVQANPQETDLRCLVA